MCREEIEKYLGLLLKIIWVISKKKSLSFALIAKIFPILSNLIFTPSFQAFLVELVISIMFH